MNGYLAVLKIRVKVLLQYRAAAFAGIITQAFWGLLNVMIFKAFFSQSAGPEPITLAQTITFVWLGQALLQVLPWTVDRELEAQVKNGHVAYELIRPLDLYRLWYVRAFAMRLIPTLMRCFPIFICGGLFFGLAAPISWQAGGIFCLSVCFALFLSAAIITLVIVSLFWTVSGDGIQRLLPHIVTFFSGMIVPLPLFPAWAQPFLNWQPFRGVMDIPCRLYTGVIPVAEAPHYLLFQLAWTACFILLGKTLMHRALKQFVIQGG